MLVDRLPGVYRGRVTANEDPEGLLRLKAQVPQLLGETQTDWAWPAIPIAVGVAVPAVGEAVWITFEAGEIDRPVWMGVWRSYKPGGADPDINFGGVVTETNFGQAPSNGTAQTLARSDHTHGSPINPIPAHEAAANPHPGYVTPAELDTALIPFATDADVVAEAAARSAADAVVTAAYIAADVVVTNARIAADAVLQASLNDLAALHWMKI